MPASAPATADEQRTALAEPLAVTSLRPFFEPRTVAVIGAGRHRGRIGAEIFHNLAAGGFRGRIVPVNVHAGEIDGVTAYPSVLEIPGSVDLAVIAVPAPSDRDGHPGAQRGGPDVLRLDGQSHRS